MYVGRASTTTAISSPLLTHRVYTVFVYSTLHLLFLIVTKNVDISHDPDAGCQWPTQSCLLEKRRQEAFSYNFKLSGLIWGDNFRIG